MSGTRNLISTVTQPILISQKKEKRQKKRQKEEVEEQREGERNNNINISIYEHAYIRVTTDNEGNYVITD